MKRKYLETLKKNRKKAKKKALKIDKKCITLSIALPGSIVDNAQSPELKSYLCGQIARAASIFCVDEIVVFDDFGGSQLSDSNVQLGNILQYLECPQYLRKYVFPQHRHLQFAGLLNPLDSPHHLRRDEHSQYREGVVLNKPIKEGKGSYVDVGLSKELRIDKAIVPGTRVTVKLVLPTEAKDPESLEVSPVPPSRRKKLKGLAVSPAQPRRELGIYWGYTVRLASTFGKVFTECPYKKGYDLLIGTSDKGTNITDVPIFKPHQHALIVFGGVKGIEAAIDADERLEWNDPLQVFDCYVNVCPNQGSRTIRTEEAVLIALSGLQRHLHPS